MPKKKKKINKKIVSAALASAAAVGVGVALSNKKTRQKLTKEAKKLSRLGKKEVDTVIKKIRDAKIISEDKIKKISNILTEKEKKL